MNKILLLASQHGNELLGEQLYKHIQLHYPECLSRIDFMIANPLAHKRGVRFVDTDLNRSYKQPAISYEEKRAQEILSYIQKTKPAIVLDLHTTTADQSPCFIVSKLSISSRHFLGSTNIQYVVRLSDEITKYSLIGKVKDAVSIEINEDTSDNLLDILCDGIAGFLGGKREFCKKQFYDVNELILKSTGYNLKKLKNFRKSIYGFYPILVGEEAYKKDKIYIGFKSVTKRTIKL